MKEKYSLFLVEEYIQGVLDLTDACCIYRGTFDTLEQAQERQKQ